MKRPALILFLFVLVFGAYTASQALALNPTNSPAVSHRVSITRTVLPEGSTVVDIGTNQWSVQGYNLRGLLAHIYNLEPARIELRLPSKQADLQRFDVSLSLAGDETDDFIREALSAALERRFHLTTSLVTRAADVFVLSAPHGIGPGLHLATSTQAFRPAALEIGSFGADAGKSESTLPESITVAERVCPGISSAGITARAASMLSLARTLEQQLQRPILDETNLAGAYNFEIPEFRSREQLFSLLHEQLGIEIAPARRQVAILTVEAVVDLDSRQTAASFPPREPPSRSSR